MSLPKGKSHNIHKEKNDGMNVIEKHRNSDIYNEKAHDYEQDCALI